MKTIAFLGKFQVLIITILTGVVLMSCQKSTNYVFPDPSTLPKGLIGSWVETSTITDTIIFHSNRDTGTFWLTRGFEIRNGYVLPVMGSSGYLYGIFSDSIYIEDGFSSSDISGTYPFRFDEPNLTITVGKFSKYINTSKSILTFRKIK